MNRIYQGKVTAVEIPDGKDDQDKSLIFHSDIGRAKLLTERIPLLRSKVDDEMKARSKMPQEQRQQYPDSKDLQEYRALRTELKREWQDAVWRHHELFQDAVNYYTLAIVALGSGLPDDHPITKLRERMRTAWDEFPKKTPTPAISLGRSLQQYLGADAKMTFDDACRTVVSPDVVSLELSRDVAILLVKDLSQTSDIAEYGRSAGPRYFNPDYSGNFRDEFARKGLEAVQCRLAVHGLVEKDLKKFGALSLATASKRENWGDKTGEDAKSALKKHVSKLKKEKLLTESEAESLETQIKHLKAEDVLLIPAYEAGGESREKSLGIPVLLLGKQFGFTDAIQRCLAATIARPPDNWQKMLSTAEDLVKQGEDPLRAARGQRGFVFKAFTALPAWITNGDARPSWIEFDIAAFKEALKTINQFNEKTKEREERKAIAQAELDFMLGKRPDWKPKTGVEEEDREVPILAGDFRYAKLVALLKGMDFDREEQAKGEIIGPTQAALRGFGKLRAEWMDLFNKAVSEPNETDLREAVTDLQRDHKLDMGHTDFFLKLCERENWDIWRDATAEESATNATNRWSRNIIYAAADAQGLADELVRLNEAIRYTPAEPEYSRRLFMFSDIKNKEATKHVRPGTVDVCIATKKSNGKLEPMRVRLLYGARRMVRDQIADGMTSRWLQPMMKALGLDVEDHGKLTKESAVALMPDWVGRKGHLHFLLNFPVDIDTDSLAKKIGKLARWDKQLNASWEKNKLKQRFHLLWEGMEKDVKDSQIPGQWWWNNADIRQDGFSCLSIDMSQRRAADFAILETSPKKTDDSFVTLGEAGGLTWRTRIWKSANPGDEKVPGLGSLRLPGEDAEVFRLRTKQDQERRPKLEAAKNSADFRTELWGSKGRKSTPKEYAKAIELARILLHSSEKAENWLGESYDYFSFPEQNDKLIRLHLGALSRFRTWHRWSWRLKIEHSEIWAKTFKEIVKFGYFSKWVDLAKLEENETPRAASANELQKLIADEAEKLREFLQLSLLKIASRVVPLRDNTWRWIGKPDTQGKPLHQLLADGDKPEEKPLVRGQRGLSLARIEQLEDFRRSILSLNRLLRHPIGEKPDFGSATCGDALPDPCAVLTDKIVRMKEERVNQTAHMILAQALGVRLKFPGSTDEERKEREDEDIHGEYERIPGRQPVDFIVLEDLSRYTTDKSRAPTENSRLMKWCHRAINEKVKMLAEPFGIPVLEVFAAYTSKFDARTGEPGFRAGEVCAKDRVRWKQSIAKKPEVAAVFDQLDLLAAHGVKNARLLIPQQGGSLFIAAKPINDLDAPESFPKIRQADINASVNIGLRAIGGPRCYHAHPRVRIELEGSTKKTKHSGKKSNSDTNTSGKWLTRRDNKREKAQFPEQCEVKLELSANSILLKDGSATLMHDPLGIATYGRALIANAKHPLLVHQAAIFSRMRNERGEFTGAVARLEWEICRIINASRVREWGVKSYDENIAKPASKNEGDEDNLQF